MLWPTLKMIFDLLELKERERNNILYVFTLKIESAPPKSSYLATGIDAVTSI